MPIFSRKNPLVKRYRQVRAGGDRESIFLEGVRLIEDAVRSGIELESAIVARDLLSRPSMKRLIDRLTQRGVRCEVTTWELLEYLSDVETPQGIVAIARRASRDLEQILEQIEGIPLLVVVEAWRDPGNLGTLVRSAEALGADAIITTPQTVDPFSPKVIRASMGAALRLPVIERVSLRAALAVIKQRGLHILAAVPHHGQPLTTVDLRKPLALLMGNEAFGLSQEALASATMKVTIPMRRQVESLNVAMAATILLYEAARQRNFDKLGGHS